MENSEGKTKRSKGLLNNTNTVLAIIVILGFVLRIVAALNLGVFADDMHYAAHAVNFIGSGKLQTWDQAPLWYVFTDVAYKIFGQTQFASRLASVVFGTLSILVVFLMGREIFNKRFVGLIAASLVAFSPFLIKNTLAEMDLMMMFFSLLFIFLFLVGMRKNNIKIIYIAMISLGVGALTKHYALLFLPPMLVYYYLKKKKKTPTKQVWKELVIFCLIFTVVVSPMLISNYLTYKSRGIMDFQFTRLLNVGGENAAKYYSWVAGYDGGVDVKGFFFGNSRNYWTGTPTFLVGFSYLLHADILVFIFGLMGMIYLFKKHREQAWLIFFLFIIPFFVMASTSLMGKHFLFESFLLSLPAGVLIYRGCKRYKFKFKYVFILILIINMLMLGMANEANSNFYNSNAENKLMKFKSSEISNDDLIIVDSRIYNARTTWLFSDKRYMDSSAFVNFVMQQGELPGEMIIVQTYFVECVPDDCGWGNVYKQPEFNQSVESILASYTQTSSVRNEISEKPNKFNVFGFGQGVPNVRYRIHEQVLQLNPAIFRFADSTHAVFMYPLGYSREYGEIFDDYDLNPISNRLIYKLGKIVLWIDFVMVFVLIAFGIKYLKNEKIIDSSSGL